MASLMALLEALPTLIQSLPYLFQVMLKMVNLMEKFVLWAEKKEFNQFLSDCEATLDQLEKAKTPEERRASARSMVELIRKLS